MITKSTIDSFSNFIAKSSLKDSGDIVVSLGCDLFPNKVYSLMCHQLDDILESSKLCGTDVILRIKSIPDYDALRLLRGLKVPIDERGRFLVLNKGN